MYAGFDVKSGRCQLFPKVERILFQPVPQFGGFRQHIETCNSSADNGRGQRVAEKVGS